MAKLPEFKPNYKYSDIGTVVGTIVYSKELLKKDGTPYGMEFLVNVKGHGSINLRVPSMYKAQAIAEQFPAKDKPKVRFGLVTVDSYKAKTGKVYTNFTTFAEPSEAVTNNGEEIADKVKGKIGGEVANIVEKDGIITFWVVSYRVDGNGELIKNRQGQPFAPLLVKMDIVDEDVKKQFNKEVEVGTNVEVGYSYINKDDISFDEFGLPTGSGQKISRLEAKRLIVHAGKKAEPVVEDDPFGSDPFAGAFELSDDEIPF